MGMVSPHPCIPNIPTSVTPAGQPLPAVLPVQGPPGQRIGGGISPALSDFIEFQTMIASSKNLHLKDQKRVSVSRISFLSAALAGGITTFFTGLSAIKGEGQKLFLIPIFSVLAIPYGAMLGLLLNHDRD